MDSKSLEILEFPEIKKILAGFTSFSASRQLALAIEPVSDYGQIDLRLRHSAEARRLLSLQPGFSIGGVTDIRELAGWAARGKLLEPQTLIEIQDSLAAMRQLRNNISKVSREFPLLWNIAGEILDLGHVEKSIAKCLGPTAEVVDSASAKLASVRQQLRVVHNQLLERLEGIMESHRGRRIVQEPIVIEREGRYVIPIKIEHRKEIKGIVHDVSNTGATVFLEPWATIDMGNAHRELMLEEKREVERILRTLSDEVGSCEPEISQNVALIAELDLILAKARYAEKARAVEPMIIPFGEDGSEAARPFLRLTEARHPLLGDKAVPLSVELGRDFCILVVTGPNTGGKTVALKTIGLLSLMTQAGIPIPASAGSQIPVFDGIFADIGDEQSIEQTLSTFSWHIGNIKRIINSATAKSLVLLDELGTSTDPDEGSALARSILLYILSRKIMAAATTHFGDLKAFAHTTPGLRNASLDFDPVTLAPTYHLVVGLPGGSHALVTAARLGLPAEIITSARSMLSASAQNLGTLLADLMTEKRTAESIRRELEREKNEVEARKGALESELERLKVEERRIIQEARDKVVREAAELHKEIRQAASDLRREKKIEQARRAVAEVRERLQGEAWQPQTANAAGEMPDEGRIREGDTVWLREANLEATVLSISEETQQVEVQARGTRIELNLDGIERVEPSPDKAGIEFVPLSRPKPTRPVSLELHLRGKRADEVELLLDSYLNDAALANLSEVRVIHGHGTGTLRSIVRKLLATHPLVKSFRPGERGEGGDGVTMVRL